MPLPGVIVMREYDDIADCALAYARAREALRLRDSDLTVYEAVLRTRMALVDCLIAAGWSPPVAALDLLAMDHALLNEPRGVMEPRSATD
jgi:hypothetical protein